ncbi:hypothetical protein AB0A71_29705 [Kitasatospora aureofaciens]|uniref:hypothetical protein n=1 Tax=Kitasatospora aureofaciens TaxID=1894 RepID=UPI00340CC395
MSHMHVNNATGWIGSTPSIREARPQPWTFDAINAQCGKIISADKPAAEFVRPAMNFPVGESPVPSECTGRIACRICGGWREMDSLST